MALLKKKTGGSKSNSIRDKFKKRSSDTLQKSYEDKDKRSGGGFAGKSIFDTEKMEQFGIEEYKPNKHPGEHFFNILVQSYEDDVPYFKQVSVHMGVGMDNDQYICMQRYEEGEKCARCAKQAWGWRELDKDDPKIKQQLVSMYPSDRAIYLVYDVSKKYTENGDPEPIIKIWSAPKKMVHSEIQDLVRDKKSGKIIDISDIDEDEGRIVFMKAEIKEDKKAGSKFPNYGSFDLLERDDPIPDEVLEKLDELISAANEEGMSAIEYLLKIPDQDEIEESQKTEVLGEEKKSSSSNRQKLNKKKEEEPEEKNPDELIEELMEMNTFKLKKWMKDNDCFDLWEEGIDKEELIEAIIDKLSE